MQQNDSLADGYMTVLAAACRYLDRFTEAIAVLSAGLELHPAAAELLRHRAPEPFGQSTAILLTLSLRRY